MSYQELSRYGTLRKVNKKGPYSMFLNLVYEWNHLPPSEVAEKVKKFFKFYAINRHKSTVITPSYHAESYSPDDNRYDHRPFLYPVSWDWQFEKIDKVVEMLEQKQEQIKKSKILSLEEKGDDEHINDLKEENEEYKKKVETLQESLRESEENKIEMKRRYEDMELKLKLLQDQINNIQKNNNNND